MYTGKPHTLMHSCWNKRYIYFLNKSSPNWAMFLNGSYNYKIAPNVTPHQNTF